MRQPAGEDIRAAVRALVDQAPLLSPEQQDLIRAAFRGLVVPRQRSTPVEPSRTAA